MGGLSHLFGLCARPRHAEPRFISCSTSPRSAARRTRRALIAKSAPKRRSHKSGRPDDRTAAILSAPIKGLRHHLDDPTRRRVDQHRLVVRGIARHLRPGGTFVFHEADWRGARSFPPAPTYDLCCDWIVKTFRKVGTSTQMGLSLHSAFLSAAAGSPASKAANIKALDMFASSKREAGVSRR